MLNVKKRKHIQHWSSRLSFVHTGMYSDTGEWCTQQMYTHTARADRSAYQTAWLLQVYQATISYSMGPLNLKWPNTFYKPFIDIGRAISVRFIKY